MHDLIAKMTAKVASASLDQVTRLKILEGIAGVTPGKWSDRGSIYAAFDLAAEALPDVDPEWFSRQDRQVYNAMIRGAMQVNDFNVIPEEIAQDILAGFSRSSNVRGGQLYEVGTRLRGMAAGDQTRVARAWLRDHAHKRALDQKRRGRKEEQSAIRLTPGQAEEGTVHEIPAHTDDSTIRELLAEALLGRHGGNLYKVIRDEVGGQLPESQRNIFDAWLRSPRATAVDIARELGTLYKSEGVESATYVSRILRKITNEILPDVIRSNPKILFDLTLKNELSSLGFGRAASASMVQLAVNLAHRLSTAR